MWQRLSILLFLIIVPSRYAQAQVKEIVLKETFVDNSTGWPEDIVRGEFSASVNDYTYNITYDKSNGSKTLDVPVKMCMNYNYFIEMEGRIKEGNRNSGLGIVWGKGNKGHFVFVVTNDGLFFVRKVKTNSGGDYLLGPMKSKQILPIGRKNKIRVQFSDDELMFFINDKYVGHLPAEINFGINAGVVMYGRQKSEISNFGAYGTKNYERIADYHAAMKVSYYEIEDGQDEFNNNLGNGDCKIQPGETVQLDVTLRNAGYGKCSGLNAKFYSSSRYITILDQDVVQTINNVDRSQTHILTVKFKVSDVCTVERVNFKIDITNDKGQLAETVPMTVPLHTKIAPINKNGVGHYSFTFNVKELDYHNVDTFFPITLQNNQNTMAVVVAVETYMNLPKARYATNDGRIFRSYLLNVCNLKSDNVIAISNKYATLKRLNNIMKMGGEASSKMKTNFILYFSGLGMCDPLHNDIYIMLYDSDSGDPIGTGYSVTALLRAIKNFTSGQIICIFETSFSGVDRNGKSFILGGGTWSNMKFPIVKDNNTCMMYASGGRQLNPIKDETSHGMFTYCILSAIQNYARNRNTLTVRTLSDYILQTMDKESSNSGIDVFPRIDCINMEGIKILK